MKTGMLWKRCFIRRNADELNFTKVVEFKYIELCRTFEKKLSLFVMVPKVSMCYVTIDELLKAAGNHRKFSMV